MPKARASSGMTMQRKYDRLARGEFFEPVVQVATAYVAAAMPGAVATEGEYWALSCLPGTTPGRLSALTMRATDIVVIYQVLPKTPGSPVDALMIVERSTLESGFGRRAVAAERYPHLHFVDSEYYGAGEQHPARAHHPLRQRLRRLGHHRVAQDRGDLVVGPADHHLVLARAVVLRVHEVQVRVALRGHLTPTEPGLQCGPFDDHQRVDG